MTGFSLNPGSQIFRSSPLRKTDSIQERPLWDPREALGSPSWESGEQTALEYGTRKRIEEGDRSTLDRPCQLGNLMDSSTTNAEVANQDDYLQDQIDEMVSQAVEENAPQEALGLASARALNVLGLLLLGAGLSLAAAPHFSWSMGRITEWLATHGFATGTLTIGGLILLGCGTIGNALARLAKRPRTSDMGMVDAVERMAGQISMLTGSLTHLYEQVTVLGLRDSTVHIDAPPPSEDLVHIYREQKDAVFQLAAGLDKLGHQVSEQLSDEMSTVNVHFETLRTKLAAVELHFTETIERELRASIKSAEPDNLEPTAEVALDNFSDPVAREVASFAENEGALERDLTATTITEFARINDLMDETESPSQAGTQEVVLEDPHPDLEADVSPIAFLEGLKAIAPASQNPHSPSVSAPALDFDLLDSPPAALPASPDRQAPIQKANKQQHNQTGQ